MKFWATGVMLLAFPGCASAQNASFLAGYWLACANGQEVSETWSDARGKMMIGSSITLEKGEASWEFNRIAPSANGLTFFAAPSGQPAAEFPLSATKSGPNRLVFENLAHDFPQRIILALDGKHLKARIEGTTGGKFEAMDWDYAPAALNQRCPR